MLYRKKVEHFPMNITTKLTVLVTGASRGIGLGFVTEFLKKNYRVIACCRNPALANNLQRLKLKDSENLIIEELNVIKTDHFENLNRIYKNKTIDILINNAGIFPENHSRNGIQSTTYEEVTSAFATNALGALLAIQHFESSLLQSAHPRIINISSLMGSLASAKGFGYSYRMSKASLNMLTRSFADENKRIITIALRPGWVKTTMGGVNANITVKDSVDKMIKVIESLTLEDSGSFFDNEKNHCEW